MHIKNLIFASVSELVLCQLSNQSTSFSLIILRGYELLIWYCGQNIEYDKVFRF